MAKKAKTVKKLRRKLEKAKSKLAALTGKLKKRARKAVKAAPVVSKSAPVVSVQRGDWLKNLPASRAEAKAVGTENDVLLGRRASEAALRKLVMRQRWRAVHVACHAPADLDNVTYQVSLLGVCHDVVKPFVTIIAFLVPSQAML